MVRRNSRPFFLKKRYPINQESIIHRAPFVSTVSGSRPPRKRRKWVGKLVAAAGWLVVLGIVGGILGTAFVFAWVSRDLPDPNRLLVREVQKSTKIWDRTGTHLLYEVHGDQKRTLIELKDVSPYAVKAAIASEDREFYTHKGVQLKSFLRAIWTTMTKGTAPSATSTITQQVVKNTILTNERTIQRKIKEIVLSYQIEQRFSKDDILKIYFNEIPYGSTAYGIESAAQTYFGKSAKDLDAGEGALLAAMVRAPTRLSPYGGHKDELLWWQHYILDTMAQDGAITKDEADKAKAIDIIAEVKPRRESIVAPHFSLYVKEQLADKYGEQQVEQGGLNVITTLDYDKQMMAEKAVTDGMPVVKQFDGSNAALVAMDPKTGQILAMVGSADYFDTAHDGNVNVALANRQPGSSIKPIVYATAFEKGYTPSTVLFDTKTSFPTDTGTPYEPNNYDGTEHGPVTMKKALAGSLNIPAVKTLYLAGIDNAITQAQKMGYTTLGDRSRFGLSLVLGGGEVKLTEHVAAYSVFATEGAYHPPSTILKVTDGDGKTLEEWQEQKTDGVVSVETTRNITDILSDNSARSFIFGEKNFLTLADRPIAAKTGTTNGFHDAWTLGYTPSLAAGVWVGNNDNKAMKNKADGSKVAAPIWHQFMQDALAGTPVETFTAPLPIVTGKPVLDGQAGEIHVNIDKFSGKLATADTPPTAIEEHVYRQAHDILYYVNKDDPRGPVPTDPTQDPQFAAWEAGVQDWAQRNNWTVTEPPPTATDDVHVSGDVPQVSFVEPTDGGSIPARVFHAQVMPTGSRTIVRVEYYLEGALAATSNASPWDADITIPSTFGRGFYDLKAVAYDSIESNGSRDISINVLTDGQPLVYTWARPSIDKTVTKDNFPLIIDTAISEHIGIAEVDLFGAKKDGTLIPIGTLTAPKTNGVSVAWQDPPDPDVYSLYAVVKLTNGDEKKFVGPSITVK